MRTLYIIYQILIAIPVFIILTLLTALTTTFGCILGNGNVWGYYPGKIWSKLTCAVFLLPVKVEGRERLSDKTSYVFVANHQGAFDIFLIYGYLHRNFKWMMKKSLRKLPFVGKACEEAGHIFVDKSSPQRVKATMEQAEHVLKDGVSLVVFPEGARTFDGKIQPFKRGAYQVADELRLPVVPLTINGSFTILPRTRKIVSWYPLTLTIHKPIFPLEESGADNVKHLMEKSYQSIVSALED